MRIPLARAVGFVLAATAPPVLAVESCDLDGQPVNPANGYTTQGKSGLMRCRDGEGGPVVREQELKNGVFMGVVRYFKDGSLEREYRVNERGNRDGPAREWARTTNAGKPVLVREETYRNGSTVGLARSWYSSGQLRRVSFHDDASHELASAEFTPQGQLSDLRCASRAVLGSDADDGKLVRPRRPRFERHPLQRQGRRQGARLVRPRRAPQERIPRRQRHRSRSPGDELRAAASSAPSTPTAPSGAKCNGSPSPASAAGASRRSIRSFTRAASSFASSAGAPASAAASESPSSSGT